MTPLGWKTLTSVVVHKTRGMEVARSEKLGRIGNPSQAWELCYCTYELIYLAT